VTLHIRYSEATANLVPSVVGRMKFQAAAPGEPCVHHAEMIEASRVNQEQGPATHVRVQARQAVQMISVDGYLRERTVAGMAMPPTGSSELPR
jgi:hypothetical protein